MSASRKTIHNHSENRAAREDILQDILDKMTQRSKQYLDAEDLQTVRDDIAGIALWDAENGQREIANLIAVANSTAFELETRTEARDRVITMLEL